MSLTQVLNSANTTFGHRRYPGQRPPPIRKRASKSRSASSATVDVFRASTSSRDIDIRPVLVPLHPNLRRLPSRVHLVEKPMEICDTDQNPRVGSKRKRVASGGNENTHHGGRPTRGSGQLKRFKTSRKSDETSEDDEQLSSMDVDDVFRRRRGRQPPHVPLETDSDNDDEEEEDEDEDAAEDAEDETSDDYLISSAPSRALKRMRKDDLVRLYTLAGLSDDTESFTKSDLVQAIIDARDDLASLPPSSPLGRGGASASGSSDYSSDEPKEDPTPMANLRRRVTATDVTDVTRESSRNRPLKSRSFSMGHLNDSTFSSHSRRKRQASNKSMESSGSRRSSRSSPASGSQQSISSPPAHHLRSRKTSAPSLASFSMAIAPHLLDPDTLPTPNGLSGSGTTPTDALSSFTFTHRKGKSRQVEFDEPAQSSKTPSKGSTAATPISILESESDLTDLEDLEAKIMAQPSPRRLRSKDKDKDKEKSRLASDVLSADTLDARRVTPMRTAKKKIQTLKEDDTEEDEEADDEEEVDELVSTPVQSSARRTPMRRRLRSLSSRNQENADPSDGDDESGDQEEVEEEGEEEDEVEEDEGEEDDEATIAVEPRKLRNGKIVGDEDVEMVDEEDEEEGNEEGEEEEQVDGVEEDDDDEAGSVEAEEDEEPDDEANSIDLEVDADGDTGEETLVRLRRDDLVRLCEHRDLEPTGTKPQLATALLQWRDSQPDFSSTSSSCPSSIGPLSSVTPHPSSTATVRPKRGNTRGGRKSSQKTATPPVPVLLRSERVHFDEPLTPIPPISSQAADLAPAVAAGSSNNEPELELDLESLGLEDREIPPDKLSKVEKIGSGGFKDVFVGKYKTRGGPRKVAISEFRGQLNAMDIKELKLLGGFDHANIVRFIGVSIPENTRDTPVMIVSELCTNGDLFDYVRNVSPPSMRKVLSIMLDIARGLEYLHLRKPSVIHRDCKSSNILITGKGVAKIADFGLAKVKQSTRSMVRSLVGTVNWQAPELWHAHPKYNHKVDVFSCACVYWEMLQWHVTNKKFPWEGMNEHAIYELVGTKKQRPNVNGLRKQWCPEIVDLIERMWAQEHQDRPTMSEVVNELQKLVEEY
ncbi:hypothetical protein D9757_003564 [Collybiopsis confluens]|uniref:Protein kinase domain-containing protein n=1 Tax=Collybiopsis confluens TaxID=2823264 RepID=A0A8H5HVI3_9AGAR|nr:hypothetical protein D9757_003564 [Collybiopsis confluens]